MAMSYKEFHEHMKHKDFREAETQKDYEKYMWRIGKTVKREVTTKKKRPVRKTRYDILNASLGNPQ